MAFFEDVILTDFKKTIEKGLASVKKHMQEENENLKCLLEKE